MDVDEYIKKVEPARCESVLAPYKKDLQRLKAARYTLSQMQSFLAANNVMVSRSWISEYLNISGSKTRRRPQTDQAQVVQENPIQEKSTRQSVDSGAMEDTGPPQSHNPKALDQVISSMPDLDSLSKAARSKK